ncbi:hypothetical protein TNCV_2435101 [Trichonephila clavipes]|nr:hypothetical protein TNCV_2435101 [Trichonephila clavipes]
MIEKCLTDILTTSANITPVSNIRSSPMKFNEAKVYIFMSIVTLALSIIQVTVRFTRSSPILRDKTLEVISGLPPLFPFHQNLTR